MNGNAQTMQETDPLEVAKLTRDMRRAAVDLSHDQARYLVDSYYAMQRSRIRLGNQLAAAARGGEPHATVDHLAGQASLLEQQIARALDSWTQGDALGRWTRSVHGIGPVLAAGLLAHGDRYDPERPPIRRTVGELWRFAGLDPSQRWHGQQGAERIVREVLGAGAKGVVSAEQIEALAARANVKPAFIAAMLEGAKPTVSAVATALAKRPWNAALKRLCFLVGDSFVKFSASEKCFYGQIYRARKAQEVERNEAGAFAAQAERALAERNIRDRDLRRTYEAGRLPDGRIDLRARRYAVKLFLAHFHEQGWRLKIGEEPPSPYPIAALGHAHYIAPPNS